MSAKLRLYEAGVVASRAFLVANGLPAVARYKVGRCASTGEYSPRFRAIVVDLDATALPTDEPGNRRWSYPGYKVDRTAFGVVAHETGHHVDAVIGVRYNEWLRLIRTTVKRVSGYEPNAPEAFAETMKLFITNPDLLRVGLPIRYYYLAQQLGLKPIVNRTWREILPVGFHPTVERWIAAK